MDKRCFFFALLLMPGTAWNNLNCPAPRAPRNGLSFIFRDGALVHYRCHPGHVMQGKPVASCINNEWTEATPECLRIRRFPSEEIRESNTHLNNYRTEKRDFNHLPGQVFHWAEKPTPRHQSIYGEGPRRLPLINGIWPPENANSLLPLNLHVGPGPKTAVREEIDIAELRHRQLEELKGHRYSRNKAHRLRRTNHNRRKSHARTVQSSSIHSRPSRVDTGSSYSVPRSSLFDSNLQGQEEFSPVAPADASCVERLYGREVPMRAPQVPNAFVFRYETRKDPSSPFGSYMLVKYRCLRGYSLVDPKAEALHCREAAWVGEKPRCKRNAITNRI